MLWTWPTGQAPGPHPAARKRLDGRRRAGTVPLVLTAVLLLGCVGLARRDPRLIASPGGAAPAAAPPTVSSRPNLVVVLSDDHRWDALGAAGNPAVVTPVMNRMVRDGVYFRQAIASVSQCHPVRASLLTGLPAHRHGVYSIQFQAPGVAETLCRRPTVASLLRDAGYHTVIAGKWHVPPPPWKCGFAEVRTWLPDGGTHYRDPELVRGISDEHETVAGFTQEIFTDAAVDFLRGEAARAGPFLLWLGFTAPHFPYEPNPKRIEALYAGRSDEQLLPPGFPRGVPANDWRHYAQAVSHLDEQLGRLLAALRETGLAERTVVVLLGDNGYMMGERGVGGPGSRSDGKTVPYESSLRVPFVLLGPGLPEGLVSDLPVSSLDLPPTLLSLAGLPVPDSWPGRDLVAALAGKLELREAFAEWSDEDGDKFGHLAFRAVRTSTHKLILWKDPSLGEELYDLVADPAEARNLIADPAAREVLRDLRSRLFAWMQRNADPALSWPAAP
jgi:choline-sulfatase